MLRILILVGLALVFIVEKLKQITGLCGVRPISSELHLFFPLVQDTKAELRNELTPLILMQKCLFLQFKDSEQFLNSVPYSAAWVAVEMGGQPLESFIHPNRCVYILGSEDHGLPKDILTRCRFRVTLPSVNSSNFNVSAAGSILMYDRYLKRNTPQCVIDSTQSIDYKQNGNPRNKRKIWRQQ
mmetsp:Transcript_16547/g.20439  ORF Transcript_16547/g.20439 Transcript_16547/m.20439 type:complete len:184 (-) Transcript_16547:118-669(-)